MTEGRRRRLGAGEGFAVDDERPPDAEDIAVVEVDALSGVDARAADVHAIARSDILDLKATSHMEEADVPAGDLGIGDARCLEPRAADNLAGSRDGDGRERREGGEEDRAAAPGVAGDGGAVVFGGGLGRFGQGVSQRRLRDEHGACGPDVGADMTLVDAWLGLGGGVVERIEELDAGAGDVAGIARNEDEVVGNGCRGEKAIDYRQFVGRG